MGDYDSLEYCNVCGSVQPFTMSASGKKGACQVCGTERNFKKYGWSNINDPLTEPEERKITQWKEFNHILYYRIIKLEGSISTAVVGVGIDRYGEPSCVKVRP